MVILLKTLDYGNLLRETLDASCENDWSGNGICAGAFWKPWFDGFLTTSFPKDALPAGLCLPQ